VCTVLLLISLLHHVLLRKVLLENLLTDVRLCERETRVVLALKLAYAIHELDVCNILSGRVVRVYISATSAHDAVPPTSVAEAKDMDELVSSVTDGRRIHVSVERDLATGQIVATGIRTSHSRCSTRLGAVSNQDDAVRIGDIRSSDLPQDLPAESGLESINIRPNPSLARLVNDLMGRAETIMHGCGSGKRRAREASDGIEPATPLLEPGVERRSKVVRLVGQAQIDRHHLAREGPRRDLPRTGNHDESKPLGHIGLRDVPDRGDRHTAARGGSDNDLETVLLGDEPRHRAVTIAGDRPRGGVRAVREVDVEIRRSERLVIGIRHHDLAGKGGIEGDIYAGLSALLESLSLDADTIRADRELHAHDTAGGHGHTVDRPADAGVTDLRLGRHGGGVHAHVGRDRRDRRTVGEVLRHRNGLGSGRRGRRRIDDVTTFSTASRGEHEADHAEQGETGSTHTTSLRS
jgi:hypothetical protein